MSTNSEWACSLKRGDGSAQIGANDSDPNSVAPTAATIIVTPTEYQLDGQLWLWCKTAAPTVTVWIYDATSTRWLPILTTQALSLTVPTKVDLPCNARVFVQITTHNATTQLNAGWVRG